MGRARYPFYGCEIMSKLQTRFVCQSCGYSSPKWLGRCPECDEWAAMVEETVESTDNKGTKKSVAVQVDSVASPITEVNAEKTDRVSCGIAELDRTLGGGVVPGSVVLLGGDPGIGKSTILMQAASNLAKNAGRVLYVSGEESPHQIKLRADRIGPAHKEYYVVSETSVEAVANHIENVAPNFVVIDSIQTMHSAELSSTAGTVGQIRRCAGELAKIAKSKNIPVFLVGHVTKEGAIAGPKVLEHMVDTVLYFEGDRDHSYRVLRAVKNRFGSTDELGIFEMREDGLAEVENPSEVFLSERDETGSGSCVTCTVEGSRPILVEVQALVAPSYFASPRRVCTGIEYNRMLMVLAVLEKRVGLAMGNKDIYVNAAGGVKVGEPACDLACAIALASSLTDRPVAKDTVVFGEVGLAGEIRAVSHVEKRIREAQRLSFERIITSQKAASKLSDKNSRVIGAKTVINAIEKALLSTRDTKEYEV